MKIGLQLSSLKEFMQTPSDVLETFRKVKSIGYSYVQVQWVGEDISNEEIKQCLNSAGLICVSTQDSLDDVFCHMDAIIERNKLWQSKYACVAAYVGAEQEESAIVETAKKLNTVSKKLNDNEMVLELHPLFPSYVATDGIMPLDKIWKHLDNSILLQPDFYHVVRGKANPVGLVNKYAGRIAGTHFKDFKTTDSNLDSTQINGFDVMKQGAFPLTPLGKGIIPWQEIVEACAMHGVKYCYVEQEAWDSDPFECLAESFNYLVSMGLDSL